MEDKRYVSSRSETTSSALDRLRADVDEVAGILAVGRAAVPRLAMGTDDEGVVHVGMDQRGDVVRLDLDPGWRDTLSADGLGGAVSDALQQAVQVRTGDWAAAVAASYPVGRADRSRPHPERVPHAAPRADGPVHVGRDSHGPVVTIVPGWSAGTDDTSVRQALLDALTATPQPRPGSATARPAEVRDLALRTRDSLLDGAEDLPRFMRAPVQESLERVHDDVTQVLSLPLAGEGIASGELGTYASRLHECLWLVERPAGLPEAAEAWTDSASGLTAGLASARRSPRSMFSRFRRRATA